MLLEICTDSLADARAAELAGANRLEICAHLECGGLTPSEGLMGAVLDACELPCVALIRPRPGDFCYRSDELDVMARDIDRMQQLGAQAVAIGVLKPDGALDLEALEPLIECARPMQVVLHRAFDFCPDWRAALEQAAVLGFERVLSSGGAPTVMQGREQLAQMLRSSPPDLTVVPAGGVSEQHIDELVTAIGAQEWHASARCAEISACDFSVANRLAPSVPLAEGQNGRTSKKRVEALAKALAAGRSR